MSFLAKKQRNNSSERKIHFLFFFLVASLAIFSTLSFSSASTPGKTQFASKCLICHKKDGEAQEIGPSKYASIQWEKFFKREKHQKKKDISSMVFPEDIAIIQEYLMRHAADSDRPEAAGLR